MHLINQADRIFSVFLFTCAREKLEKVADCECVGPKISIRAFSFRNKSGPLGEFHHQSDSEVIVGRHSSSH